MVPAIGSLATLQRRPDADRLPEFLLPPSPAIPEIVQPAYSPFVRTFEVDPENLRPGVTEDLEAVETMWSLRSSTPSSLLSADDSRRHHSPSSDHVSILETLKATTHAVRSVRNYLLSLPDDSTTPMQPVFRAQALSSAPLTKRVVSQPNSSTDPLSRIRRSALEVLIVLRALEESSRLPLSDDAYDAQSDHGEHASVSGSHSGSGSGSGGLSRGTSPDFLDADLDTSISFVQVGGGLRSVPVWEDDSSIDLNHASEDDIREKWDERLILGGGWLYRQDIKRSDVEKEREVVRRYLDAVDETLFGGPQDDVRGWERERIRDDKERRRGRRVSGADGSQSASPERSHSNRRRASGILVTMKDLVLTEEPDETEIPSETESVEDDNLPDWAKRTLYENDPIRKPLAMLPLNFHAKTQAQIVYTPLFALSFLLPSIPFSRRQTAPHSCKPSPPANSCARHTTQASGGHANRGVS